MIELPNPCKTCRTYQYHDCLFQRNCGKVKRWNESRIKRSLDEYQAEEMRKNARKRNLRSYGR